MCTVRVCCNKYKLRQIFQKKINSKLGECHQTQHDIDVSLTESKLAKRRSFIGPQLSQLCHPYECLVYNAK